MNSLSPTILALPIALAAASLPAEVYQFSAPARDARGEEIRAFLWVPPEADRLRGALVGGLTLMEPEFARDPLIRAACAGEKLAIVYFSPALDAEFDDVGKGSGRLLQKALDDLGEVSGYRELSAAPLFPFGHSVGSIFAARVVAWRPERCFGALAFKGGLPVAEGSSIAGVPILVVKGQFEEFGPGPSGVLREFEDRETSWKGMREILEGLRKKDPRHLIAYLVEPGATHFAWSERLAPYAAGFIRRAARARIPDWPIDAREPVRCRDIDPSSGALTSVEVGKEAAAAPWNGYAGDRTRTFWHFDAELAKLADALHADLLGRKPQFVTFADPVSRQPIFTGHDLRLRLRPHWVGPDTFRVAGTFLDRAPDKYPKLEGPAGHGEGPIRFRAFAGAVEQTAPDTFRMGDDGRGRIRADILAYALDDGTFRYAEQQGRVNLPEKLTAGRAQAIAFPPAGPLVIGGSPVRLGASSDAGLPVRYCVESGPAVIEGDALRVAEVPRRARFPLPVSVLAYQYGSAVEPLVRSAEPVRMTVQVTAAPAPAPAPAASLELLQAGFWGTAGDDDVQGAAAGPDGTIYIAGNAGAPMTDLPDGVEARRLGSPASSPACGSAFVARFSSDLGKLLGYAELSEGIAIFTTVQAGERGVYIGGYASEALEPLLDGKGGLLPRYPLSEEARLGRTGGILEANGLTDKDPIAGRPGLGRRGAPCVLRFSSDLQAIEAGTYLEGWQQVWDKLRSKKIRPQETFPREFFWQPTCIALDRSGDIFVCHDGGYFRLLTDKDREIAAGDADLLRRLAFYDCPDWASRLSPDLSARRWRQPIHTPPVDPETAKRALRGWPLPHYGNPRTHRLRLDVEGSIFLCGWSASSTAKEPWWSPYVWKLDSRDGKVLARFYEYDPISGTDNRMGGTVADTAVASLALDGDGNLLASLFADGGNTVIGWSPRAEPGRRFEGKIEGSTPGIKLVHWWGEIQRIDARTREGIGGARLAGNDKGVAGPGWVVDLSSLPENRVLAVGRRNFEFPWTGDAWTSGDPAANPAAFLRLYDAKFGLLFSTALDGVVPFEIAPLSGGRFLIVGRADGDGAPVRGTIGPLRRGKSDGYLCLVRLTDGSSP
jgi:hypothetical protein